MRLNSTVRLTSDGTVQRVDLTYDVQDGDEVQVYFNDDEILTGWTLQRNTNPQRVDFDEKIPAGTLVLIRRYTDMRELPHFFHFTGNAKGGAEFNGKNLDENFDKILRAAQDAMDSFELIGINLEAASDARASANAAATSAANAANYATQANQRANSAQSSAVAAAGSATAANNHANRAEAALDGVATSAAEAEAAAVRAKDSETEAFNYQSNAEQARTAAQSSASAASASAVSAGNQASNAAASATAASGYSNTAGTHASAAAGSAAEALTHRTSAANSATAASFSEDLAQKWATNPEDQAVEEGKYSAMHWALKAAQTVVGAEDVATKDTAEIKFTGTGRPLAPLEATVGSVAWSKVSGKPTSYVGDWNTLLNKPSNFATTWSMVASKPTTFPSSWSQVADKPALASAAHTHTWDDVYNKPSAFPTTWSTVSGKPTVFPSNWASVDGKPATFPPSTHTHSFNDLTNRPSVYPTNWSNVSGRPVNRTPAFITRTTDWINSNVTVGTDITILRGNFVATPSGTATFLVPVMWMFFGHVGGTLMQLTWGAKVRTTGGGAVSGKVDHLQLFNFTAWGGEGDADVRSGMIPVQWTGLTPNATYRFDLDVHFGAHVRGCIIYASGTRSVQLPDQF